MGALDNWTDVPLSPMVRGANLAHGPGLLGLQETRAPAAGATKELQSCSQFPLATLDVFLFLPGSFRGGGTSCRAHLLFLESRLY